MVLFVFVVIGDKSVADAAKIFYKYFVEVFQEALEFQFVLHNLNILSFDFECIRKFVKFGDIVFCCYFVGVALLKC